MGGKNSKKKGEDSASFGFDPLSGLGSLKLLELDDLKEKLGELEDGGKIGFTARYVVKEDSKEDFIAAIKDLDKPGFMELFAGASIDIYTDCGNENIIWTLGKADKPEDLLKYLDDDKVGDFNEKTAEMLDKDTGYILYSPL